MFTADPYATVWPIREATHCAAEQLTRIMPAAVTWARAQLEPRSRRANAAAQLAQLPLRPLLEHG